jgi:hypothetical protein
MTEHPSYFALDRHHLNADPAIAAHVDVCAACRAHLDGLRAPSRLPAWLPERRRRPRRWVFGFSVALAAAASVALWPREGIREKGTPAIQVHLKRGDAVSPWQAGTPLRAGDRLRLQIAPAGYRFVSVATGGPAPSVLFAGALEPSGSTFLPASFRVDGAAAEETLDVVLAAEPVTPDAHRQPEPPRGGWRRRFTFPTERTP